MLYGVNMRTIYQHRGIIIHLNRRGPKYYALTRGGRVLADTLAGIKNLINNILQEGKV